MKKKKILFVANGDSSWIGGLYYVKNIMYQFLQYEKSAEEFEVYVYTTQKNRKLFEEFESRPRIHYIMKAEKKNGLYRFCDWMLNEKLGKNVDSEFWFKVLPHHFDVIYPYVSTVGVLNRNLVSWIPDFQYLHLKELFSAEEMQSREAYSGLVAKYQRS